MRFSAVLVGLYYLLMTVGINLSFHFCKGELKCFSLTGSKNLCCHAGMCSEHSHADHNQSNTLCQKDCCSTDFVNIALDVDFPLESVNNPNVDVSLAVMGVHADHDFVNSPAVICANTTRGSPPDIPLYILNSKFIFYG